jgi:hypothetical protein
MKLSLSGFGFLSGYIVMVGVASFLEKFSMKQLNPYQVNFLMAWNGGNGGACSLDQTGKSDSPNESLTFRRSHWSVDGAWFHLFCAGAVRTAGRYGYGDFDQLCFARSNPVLVLLK